MTERRTPNRPAAALAFALASWVAGAGCRAQPTTEHSTDPGPADVAAVIRVATFNVSLYRAADGQLANDLASDDPQAADIAEIVRAVRPDILLVNELDATPDGAAARLLAERYFARDGAVGDAPGLEYPHRFTPPSNTGVPSHADLDRNGRDNEPSDAYGYGAFEGQYGFALFSRFPIVDAQCFGDVAWSSLPWARLPDDLATSALRDWYDDEVRARLPLSSKNHCDVLVESPAGPLHLLLSHPTPPVFDGPEDRNGLRNNDEIQFWSRYIDTLPADASFVIAGDLNADPDKGEAPTAIRELLAHPRVQDPTPTRPGASSDRTSTADFGASGRLRVDYVLPSVDLAVRDAGVFWPGPADTSARWITASDHRLVWVDLGGRDSGVAADRGSPLDSGHGSTDGSGPDRTSAPERGVATGRDRAPAHLRAAAEALKRGFMLACADKACASSWPRAHGPTPTRAGRLAEPWPGFPLAEALEPHLELAVTPARDDPRTFLLHARDPLAPVNQPERVQVVCRLDVGPRVSERAAPQYLPSCDAPTFF